MNIVLPSFLELDWNWTGGMGIDGREWETGIEMGERERDKNGRIRWHGSDIRGSTQKPQKRMLSMIFVIFQK